VQLLVAVQNNKTRVFNSDVDEYSGFSVTRRRVDWKTVDGNSEYFDATVFII